MPDGRRCGRHGRGNRAATATDRVRMLTPVYPRQNIGRRAADIAAGLTCLPPGDVLNPSRIGALAAIGAAATSRSRPAHGRDAFDRQRNRRTGPAARARARSTTSTGSRCAPSSRSTAASPVPMPHRHGHARGAATAQSTSRGEHDMMVFSGGSSVGERDLDARRDPAARRGDLPRHRRQAGQADAFGRIDGTPVLGMPGYPTSCLSNAYILLVPLLRRMARLPDYQPAHRARCHWRAASSRDRPSPVLHRADRQRRGGAGLQGVGRHHQHVARRRLHRDPAHTDIVEPKESSST